MTLQETLDEIAEALGYEYGTWGWQKQAGDKFQVALRHPVPATLDAIAALMPKGWHVTITLFPSGDVTCDALHLQRGIPVGAFAAPTMLESFAALLLAVLRHEKADK